MHAVLSAIGSAIPGAQAQWDDMSNVNLPAVVDVHGKAGEVLRSVIAYVGLLGVIMIVLAGLYMVFSQGDEGAKDKAKKIVLYTVLGMVLIFLTAALVRFFTGLFA